VLRCSHVLFSKRIKVSTESTLSCCDVSFSKRITVSTESTLSCCDVFFSKKITVSTESAAGMFTCFIFQKNKSLNRVCRWDVHMCYFPKEEKSQQSLRWLGRGVPWDPSTYVWPVRWSTTKGPETKGHVYIYIPYFILSYVYVFVEDQQNHHESYSNRPDKRKTAGNAVVPVHCGALDAVRPLGTTTESFARPSGNHVHRTGRRGSRLAEE
jgi:hypothetical protein